MTTPTAIVDCLTSWKLKPCASLSELVAMNPADEADARTRTTAGFVERPHMQVEEHLDIDPSVLIYDPNLGTLGLVEVLDTTDPTRISLVIERAAYLRQLCLLQAERTSSNTADSRALMVELVLVFPPTAGGDAAAHASVMLRDFVRDTGYLRSIGVSLLHELPAGGFDERDLRRAFAWLLIDVRDWFARRAVRQEQSTAPWRITLTNYRHHGVRQYVFDGKAAFHVLHGYNGAGKSTLSEAFELLLTASIERLDQANQKKYFPVVRFRRRQLPGAPATGGDEASDATVEVHEGEVKVADVRVFSTAGDVDTPDRVRTWARGSSEGLSVAASFRLDQRLMDIIVHSSESKRAELFLKAYFPGEAPQFAQRAIAAAAADEAVTRVPQAIRTRVPTTVDNQQVALAAELAWTTTPPTAWSGGALPTLEPCLPVTVSQLRLLARLSETLTAVVNRFDTETSAMTDIATELESLDKALASVSSGSDVQRDLKCVIDVFTEFEAWQPTRTTEPGQSFQAALDSWLELQALADLSAKYYDVAATADAARRAGWQEAGDTGPLFQHVMLTSGELASLLGARDRLSEARAAARLKVDELSNRGSSTRTAQGTPAHAQPTRRFLTTDEHSALNRVGSWLPSLAATTTVPFGTLLAAALKDDTRESLPSTFLSARAEAEALRSACTALAAGKPDTKGTFQACASAFERLTELQLLDRNIQNSFFMQLTRGEDGGPLLNKALNELLALFKPAPWAYADISLKAGGGPRNQTQELRITTADEGRADLRLNTAEMNAFALSLCLLCAPTLKNPLGLVLLDDPLQNMDEMTVAAVARGLGRLIRVYPPGWKIVALFHSQEDLRRLQEEVPTAVYHLPWVTATPLSHEPTIQADRDFVPELQQLRELLHVPDVRPADTRPA